MQHAALARTDFSEPTAEPPVKTLHDHQCQVCGVRLEPPAGPYAEGAHVRPLGSPHEGPDTAGNILCLCPNHHVLLDLGAFSITDDLQLTGLEGSLRTTFSTLHTTGITAQGGGRELDCPRVGYSYAWFDEPLRHRLLPRRVWDGTNKKTARHTGRRRSAVSAVSPAWSNTSEHTPAEIAVFSRPLDLRQATSERNECEQRLEDRQHERPPAAVVSSMGPIPMT